jgi:hypothetical protein
MSDFIAELDKHIDDEINKKYYFLKTDPNFWKIQQFKKDILETTADAIDGSAEGSVSHRYNSKKEEEYKTFLLSVRCDASDFLLQKIQDYFGNKDDLKDRKIVYIKNLLSSVIKQDVDRNTLVNHTIKGLENLSEEEVLLFDTSNLAKFIDITYNNHKKKE